MIQIVGAGGHGHDIAAICKAARVRYRMTDENHVGFPKPKRQTKTLLGVNDPQQRWVLNNRLIGPFTEDVASAVSHPSAVIGQEVELGRGCVIGPGASLLFRVDLGWHVHIGYGSSMTRTRVGSYTTIAPGVTICGDVTIGERVFIGAGAVVKNLVQIGSDVVVGAGAVVLDDVPDGAKVLGVPAREAG